MKENFDSLKLQNQLCFPLYACAKEVIKRYQPLLNQIDLTYTQYIVMMVMWEEKQINVKHLGEKVFLDSGTLTPLLKKLELKGYLTRTRDEQDERSVIIKITENGIELRKKAKNIPEQIGKCVNLTQEDAVALYKILYKILEKIN